MSLCTTGCNGLRCIFLFQKNIPPPTPIMANGKKPREIKSGQPSVEPVDILIIEKEKSKSSKSRSRDGRSGRQNDRVANRHGIHGNGIIPNGPVAHPVTLVGTLTNNTASVSGLGLPPLIEDDSTSVSSTVAEDPMDRPSPSPGPTTGAPWTLESKPDGSDDPTTQSEKITKEGRSMTIRANPLGCRFPSEDVMQNVDNDARLQNDFNAGRADGKDEHISRVHESASANRRPSTRDVEEQQPTALYTSLERRRKQKEEVKKNNQHVKESTSELLAESVPLELNVQIKKFIDRVGYDAELLNNTPLARSKAGARDPTDQSKVESAEKKIPSKPKDLRHKGSQTGDMNISRKTTANKTLTAAPGIQGLSSGLSKDGPYAVVEAYCKNTEPPEKKAHKSVESDDNISTLPDKRSETGNKPLQKLEETQGSLISCEHIEKHEPKYATVIPKPRRPGPPEEKVPPSRSPNSMEFQRRMEKILAKQELEKMKTSPLKRVEESEAKTEQTITQPERPPVPVVSPVNREVIPQTEATDPQSHRSFPVGEHASGEHQALAKGSQKQTQAGDTASGGVQPANQKKNSTSGETVVDRAIAGDTGIYAKITPRRSPVLHKPQPITYCKHCVSGHVTTAAPELPVSTRKTGEDCPAPSVGDSIQPAAVTHKAEPAAASRPTKGSTTQYSWSDTTGTVMTAGARPKQPVRPLGDAHPASAKDSDQAHLVSSKPPPVPPGEKAINHGPHSMLEQENENGTAQSPPITRGKIAVTTAALLRQMHEDELKALQSQGGSGSTATHVLSGGAAGVAFDPATALQQILLKQAVAHHHGRDVRRFSNPKVVYLGPDMEVTASKVSIYDNVQYVWKQNQKKDDQDPN